MNKLIIIVLFLVVVGGAVFTLSRKSLPPTNDRIKITTSIYPMYFFAKEIGGDLIDVVNLTPAGVEPHDYELTSQDLISIRNSKLLIINGGVEPWEAKVEQILGDETKIIVVSDGLQTKQTVDELGNEMMDPHVWLSPTIAKVIIKRVAESLIKVDPGNESVYQDNLNSLSAKLEKLDSEFEKGLANCQQREVVTAHAAFGYLASSYGLVQVGISGISPDDEPSIRRLSEIASLVRAKNIKVIFFESLVSPKLAQVVASETGAKTAVLDPLEGLTLERIANEEDYFSVMKQNLVNLREALTCQ